MRPQAVGAGLAACAFAALAAAPFYADDYVLSVLINLVSFVVLATAWTLFSGTTHYISLATAAFFGLGAYLVALLGEALPLPLLAAVVVAVTAAVALVVGLSTLRLSGMYFTIFTFGLTELIRQVTIWYQAKVLQAVGSYVFLDVTPAEILWRLLALAAILLATGKWLLESRIGLALRAIGADEKVARHAGVDVTRIKISMFVLSAMKTALTGAIMAPRWTYIDPNIAFNPLISFETVIMALLGGMGRLWGGVLGVVPLLLISELLSTRFPGYFLIVLGLAFMAIVYLIPSGLIGLVERWRGRAP